MPKNINLYLILLISTIIFLIVFIQSTLQHWSGQWDLDFWYIYNASLIASGYEQEWFDHPATGFLILYSSFYKIYSLIDQNFIYQIDKIVIAIDPNKILQKLYLVTRLFDLINLILIVIFLFKILKIIKVNDLYTYALILTVLFSKAFLNNLSILNPEDWAILFFLISFFYYLKFFYNNHSKYLFFSGIFFGISFFSKISVLFLFIPILFCIPFLHEIYFKKDLNINFFKKYFNYLFSIYIITLVLYLVLQLILIKKVDKFNDFRGLDILIIYFINFIYIFFCLVACKFDIEKFKVFFHIFFIFFLAL